MQYDISTDTTDFIAMWEDFRAHAYWDATGKVWTCGYGHTSGVTRQTVCSVLTAKQWMRDDCRPIVKYLNSLNLNIKQTQFDAIVDFTFNVGLGNLQKSTLLKLLRQGAPAEKVAAEFLKWTRSGGKVLNGLCIRREGEYMLYLNDKYPTWGEAKKHYTQRTGRRI